MKVFTNIMTKDALKQQLHELEKKTLRATHHELALWAADCAEHIYPDFLEKYPDDIEVFAAISSAREWTTGAIEMTDARKRAFAAHKVARSICEGSFVFIARSAGHAAATAHVRTHAIHAARYACKYNPNEVIWQLNALHKRMNII